MLGYRGLGIVEFIHKILGADKGSFHVLAVDIAEYFDSCRMCKGVGCVCYEAYFVFVEFFRIFAYSHRQKYITKRDADALK